MKIENNKYLITDDDGITRCWWGNEPSDYKDYHDNEWGRPTKKDFQLFEKICLEGFQSGLSWLTILRKRNNFREAFLNFDFNQISKYNNSNISQLLQNAGIVRHRGKIEATINNAHRAIEIVDEFGSLANYIWKWKPKTNELHVGNDKYNHPIPSITHTSKLLSNDLKKRGWKFFGPTTAYAFMQAMGLVNDHIVGCFCHKEINELDNYFKTPNS